ncbi:MAG: hypothetical protein KDA65_05140 [Planctomycetaceae bacterium]|nr:hypothetical protein [Planctomycetaceae bacterium]
MTGYTVHTGSSKKYASGWDDIFNKGTKKKKATKKKASTKKTAGTKKKAAKKK